MLTEVIELKKENLTLKSKVDFYEQEIMALKNIIKMFNKEKFGSKSEVFEENPQLIFNEIEVEGKNEQLPILQETISYTRKKGRGKKKPFPEGLPREDVIIDIPESEKICPYDGATLKLIGEDIVEKLKTVPAQSIIIVERKQKYVCPSCESHLVQGKTNPILPKTIATPEILSFLIFSKFFQGLPLYRLEELYKLQGVNLSRGTMARWLIQVSEKLIPVWNVLEERVLDSGYLAIDATKLQVLKEKGREPQKDSFMWVRGSPEQGIVLFDYNVSGGGHVARNLIAGFKGGAVQADAHRGYRALDKKELSLLGCMMHARRRFYTAWVKGNKKSGLSEIGLKMIKRLYSLERAYIAQKLTPEQRYGARLKEVKPYLEKIKKWCIKKKPKVLESSDVGIAINYFVNEYEELSGFLKNGRYEIDNGWVERMIRKFAIGRNNWMFSDTVEGAHASSILYSFALTAKINGKDPFKIMTEIFKKLPYATTIEDYEKLADLFMLEGTPTDKSIVG